MEVNGQDNANVMEDDGAHVAYGKINKHTEQMAVKELKEAET